MPINKQFKSPSGASVAYHVARRIEAQLDDASQSLLIQVASWPSPQDFDATEGKSPTWVDWYPVPASAVLAAADISASVEQALVAAGGAFAGGAVEPTRDDLPGARARRWANIKQTRDILDGAPITHGAFQVDGDQQSRNDIMGAVMAMQLGGPTSRLWRCADNVMRELTLADLVAIGQAIAARRQALIETSDQLWQQLQAATTTAQVEAVVWPTS